MTGDLVPIPKPDKIDWTIIEGPDAPSFEQRMEHVARALAEAAGLKWPEAETDTIGFAGAQLWKLQATEAVNAIVDSCYFNRIGLNHGDRVDTVWTKVERP